MIFLCYMANSRSLNNEQKELNWPELTNYLSVLEQMEEETLGEDLTQDRMDGIATETGMDTNSAEFQLMSHDFLSDFHD